MLEVTEYEGEISSAPYYEFDKLDPASLLPLGPLCEEDASGEHLARVYGGVSIDGQTGAVTYQPLGSMVVEEIEAVWGPTGVLCVDTPRLARLERAEIICPTKHLEDGTVAHNWQPPSCEGFVDPNPTATRLFSLTTAPPGSGGDNNNNDNNDNNNDINW